MLRIKHFIATLAVSFGVLAAAGPASAEVIESIGTKYTMVDNAKNEISIESLEIVTPRFLPDVNDEVLLRQGGSPHR